MYTHTVIVTTLSVATVGHLMPSLTLLCLVFPEAESCLYSDSSVGGHVLNVIVFSIP